MVHSEGDLVVGVQRRVPATVACDVGATDHGLPYVRHGDHPQDGLAAVRVAADAAVQLEGDQPRKGHRRWEEGTGGQQACIK